MRTSVIRLPFSAVCPRCNHTFPSTWPAPDACPACAAGAHAAGLRVMATHAWGMAS